MSDRSIDVTAHIDNTPQAVLDYVADVRNRPLYLPSLKSISDIKGEPTATGTTWKWTWVALGIEWQGAGRCLKHEPGKLYSFTTEAGITSTWTYAVEPDGSGTKLSIHIDYDIPEKAKKRLPSTSVIDSLKKSESDHVVQNLKMILEQ